MHWYEGGIAEAVANSKAKNAIFVVYVEGKDDKSKTLTMYIDDKEVSEKLESNNFVCLKLVAGSTPHNQFAEIYKNVPVPSLFFIGKAGQPLDIITEVKSVEELSKRIDKAIEKHTGVAPKSAAASSHSLIQEEQANASSSAPANVVCNNGVCYKVTDPPQPATKEEEKLQKEDKAEEKTQKAEEILQKGEDKPEVVDVKPEAEDKVEETPEESCSLSKEEKIQRAKDIIEQKRIQKQQEEQQKEREKELERRKVGQDVQKLKQWQRDQELKDLMEQRRKEKNEDKAARERILAQIAQDRADRAARFGGSPPSSPVVCSAEPTKPVVIQGNNARLQFRLPDGRTDTNTFDNTATLQEVRNYITSNLNMRNFTLSTTFPRREFTSEQLNLSVQELELCPTAVILVLPGNGRVALTRDTSGPLGWFGGLFWLVLSPVWGIYGYIRGWFGRGQREEIVRENEGNKRSGEDQQQTSSKRRSIESTTVRRQGNIARLSDHNNSDDENNTWNGNSTQQM